MIRTPLPVNTSSNAAVSLLARSRIRNSNWAGGVCTTNAAERHRPRSGPRCISADGTSAVISWAAGVVRRPTAAWSHPVTGGHSFAGDRHLFLAKRVVSAGGGEVSTLPSRGPKRRLVPVARLDELLSRAATVGMSAGHRAAQLLDA